MALNCRRTHPLLAVGITGRRDRWIALSSTAATFATNASELLCVCYYIYEKEKSVKQLKFTEPISLP